MTALEAFQAYRNPVGLYSNSPNSSSGNDLLYSAECRLAMIALGIWTPVMQAELESSIHQSAELYPGLYERPGWSQDQEDADDYYGLATVSPAIAQKIYRYGFNWRHFWYFRTTDDAKWWEPLFLRFPGLICHVTWCAGKTPNPLLRLWWAVSVAFWSSKSNQDSWLIDWVMVSAAGDKGWLERWATKRWRKRLQKNWGTLNNVFKAYFKDQNQPLIQYAPPNG